MVGIESTIGKSHFDVQGSKRLVIPDGAEIPRGNNPFAIPEGAQEINPAVVEGMRRQALQKQEEADTRALQEVKKRIEIITGIGRRIKDVPMNTDEGDITFTLRTLKSFEQNCLAQVMEAAERNVLQDGRIVFTPTGMHKIKVEALGHSLYMIDGQDIDIVLGTIKFNAESRLESRKGLVSHMDGALIDYLFIKYEELVKETYDGYQPKTEGEAKEVVEAISKSGSDS